MFLRVDIGKIEVKIISTKIAVEIKGVKILPTNVHPNYRNLLKSNHGANIPVVIKIEILPAQKEILVNLEDFEFIVLLRIIDEAEIFGKMLGRETSEFSEELRVQLEIDRDAQAEEDARDNALVTQMKKIISLSNAVIIIPDESNLEETVNIHPPIINIGYRSTDHWQPNHL
jgi:ABC-type branched-subunit amino acid transport system substrate-binding protein